MPIHRYATGKLIHRTYAFEYADEATRLASTGFVLADRGKWARQLDNNSLWVLSDWETPTWTLVAEPGV